MFKWYVGIGLMRMIKWGFFFWTVASGGLLFYFDTGWLRPARVFEINLWIV